MADNYSTPPNTGHCKQLSHHITQLCRTFYVETSDLKLFPLSVRQLLQNCSTVLEKGQQYKSTVNSSEWAALSKPEPQGPARSNSFFICPTCCCLVSFQIYNIYNTIYNIYNIYPGSSDDQQLVRFFHICPLQALVPW